MRGKVQQKRDGKIMEGEEEKSEERGGEKGGVGIWGRRRRRKKRMAGIE